MSKKSSKQSKKSKEKPQIYNKLPFRDESRRFGERENIIEFQKNNFVEDQAKGES